MAETRNSCALAASMRDDRARFAVFDDRTKVCDGSHVRRSLAVAMLLTFVAAVAAPTIAQCRMRSAQEQCCCDPAPANSLCSPDCCGSIKSAPSLSDASVRLGSDTISARALVLAVQEIDPSSRAPASAPWRWLIGVHERAAPRLRLRV